MTEVEKLRRINKELVCSHNDLLVAIVHTESLLEDAQAEILALNERLRVLEGGFS